VFFNSNIELVYSGSLIFMTHETKKKDEQEIFTLYQTNGNFPIITCKVTLKKSKLKKKYDAESELENTKMDMIQ
jgi:hypothetical protein